VEPVAEPGEENGRPDVREALERDLRRRARREPPGASFWRSLSTLGSIGWSIALPAVGGALLGHWLDLHYATGVRFTLMLLFAGVGVGAALAWHTMRRHG
jgi:ATP synthase protein I